MGQARGPNSQISALADPHAPVSEHPPPPASSCGVLDWTASTRKLPSWPWSGGLYTAPTVLSLPRSQRRAAFSKRWRRQSRALNRNPPPSPKRRLKLRHRRPARSQKAAPEAVAEASLLLTSRLPRFGCGPAAGAAIGGWLSVRGFPWIDSVVRVSNATLSAVVSNPVHVCVPLLGRMVPPRYARSRSEPDRVPEAAW